MTDRPPFEPPGQFVPPSPYGPPNPMGRPSAYSPYAPPPTQPTSRTLAGWSLGLSLVPCGLTQILALAFGGIVLARSRDGRDHGKGLAIAAYCVVGFWIVFAGLVALVSALPDPDPDRDADGDLTAPGDVRVDALQVGDCYMVPKEGRVYGVEATPCSEPHEAEVYHLFDLTGDDYPGTHEVDVLATRGCFRSFGDFVGLPYRQSKLDVFYIFPDSKSWALGDREVVCSVYEPTDKTFTDQKTLTGTLRNARR